MRARVGFPRKIRSATRAFIRRLRDFTNHPGRCAATPPLKGGEWGRLGTNPFPSFHLERRGGCATNKKTRSLAAQTGWSVTSNKIWSATFPKTRRAYNTGGGDKLTVPVVALSCKTSTCLIHQP